jgi:hypothetical protein
VTILEFGSDGGRALLRAPTPEDLPFVTDTWVRSQRCAHSWRAVESTAYRRGFTAAVTRVLQRAETRAIVACDEESPATIYGFAVWTPEAERTPLVLHLVYVWGPMRGMGLGLALVLHAAPKFGEVPLIVTGTSAPHKGPKKLTRFEDLAVEKRLSYDPFRLLEGA